jgi:hypothetical protein
VDGVADLGGRTQHARVIAIVEHAAVAPHHPVEPFGDADREALDRAGERAAVGGLDEEMDVIALDRELDDADVEAIATDPKRRLDDAERAPAAQVVDVRRHAQGDVERHRAGPLAARAMSHAGARTAGLAARAGALATPGPELERELTRATPGYLLR